MPSYSQDGRPLAIETPLGKDKLLLEAFDGGRSSVICSSFAWCA
jgi:hypothetical protein